MVCGRFFTWARRISKRSKLKLSVPTYSYRGSFDKFLGSSYLVSDLVNYTTGRVDENGEEKTGKERRLALSISYPKEYLIGSEWPTKLGFHGLMHRRVARSKKAKPSVVTQAIDKHYTNMCSIIELKERSIIEVEEREKAKSEEDPIRDYLRSRWKKHGSTTGFPPEVYFSKCYFHYTRFRCAMVYEYIKSRAISFDENGKPVELKRVGKMVEFKAKEFKSILEDYFAGFGKTVRIKPSAYWEDGNKAFKDLKIEFYDSGLEFKDKDEVDQDRAKGEIEVKECQTARVDWDSDEPIYFILPPTTGMPGKEVTGKEDDVTWKGSLTDMTENLPKEVEQRVKEVVTSKGSSTLAPDLRQAVGLQRVKEVVTSKGSSTLAPDLRQAVGLQIALEK